MQEVNYVPGYANETFVNMRQEPSTSAAILRICTLGTEFYITGKTSEWFQVDLDGQTGYIFRQICYRRHICNTETCCDSAADV